jgi:hypothetical protein
MKRSCKKGLFVAVASTFCYAIFNASSCSPTDHDNQSTRLITFTSQIAGGTIYVTEPIDLQVKAKADDSSAVALSASGLPSGASFNSLTGRFSWRPAIGDTGTKTLAFYAGEGSERITMNVRYTVVYPHASSGEWIKILRPAGGEQYHYGDTLTIAFLMIGCGRSADISVRNRDYAGPGMLGCDYTSNGSQQGLIFGADSVDARGVQCRYFRSLTGSDYNIGFYKMALIDTLVNWGQCLADFGGGTKQQDSIKIGINDPYGATETCDCLSCDPSQTVSSLQIGQLSKSFSVIP